METVTLPVLLRPLTRMAQRNTLQFLLDSRHRHRSLAWICLKHMHNQAIEIGIGSYMQRRKHKRCLGGISTTQKMMQRRAQAINIGLRSCLSLAVLLRGCIARRTQSDRITRLPVLKEARYTEIN